MQILVAAKELSCRRGEALVYDFNFYLKLKDSMQRKEIKIFKLAEMTEAGLANSFPWQKSDALSINI